MWKNLIAEPKRLKNWEISWIRKLEPVVFTAVFVQHSDWKKIDASDANGLVNS